MADTTAPVYRTGMDVMRECGMNIEATEWSGADFEAAGLPMVVACFNCEMTMCLTSDSVRVNSDNHVFCKGCVDEHPARTAGGAQ